MLNSASGLFDKSVIPWVHRIWANNTSFEDLVVCETKLRLLDQKLAGVAQIARKEGKAFFPLPKKRRSYAIKVDYGFLQ